MYKLPCNIILILLSLLFLFKCYQCEILPIHKEEYDSIRAISVLNNPYRVMYFANGTGNFYTAGIDGTSSNTSLFYFSSGEYFPLSYSYAFVSQGIKEPMAPLRTDLGLVVGYVPTLIVEYEETNGQPGYQLGVDKVLGWIRLDSYPIFQLEISESTITAQNSNVETSVYTIDASSPNGLLTLRFIIPGTSVNVSHLLQLTSDQSKIDITIKGYYDSSINLATTNCSVQSELFKCGSTGPSTNVNSRLAVASFVLTANIEVESDPTKVSIKAGRYGNSDDINVQLYFVNRSITNGTFQLENVVNTAQPTQNGLSFMNSKFQKFPKGQLVIQSFDAIRPLSIRGTYILGLETPADTDPISFSIRIFSHIYLNLFIILIINVFIILF
ncbi:hypothetical protein DLAC_11523 [Tieghemostelium lacteum]|uniref:Transmembrane protein n=1 Tax=Tieghemostelium lacteum TaxID=361077 RepID=A0A152A307_TIELA|nr:hypothetical protein DLAC_11523 [Tieghemostelium lacteum]|eukprot:KYR00487.1 hypothetical protein DLAC_11523 [Tieghemostelium lacteum]